MNSPPEVNTPSSSNSSSPSPPPEDKLQSIRQPPQANQLLNLVSSALSSATGTASPSSKRRLPTGPSFNSGSSRDTKTRRREDPRRQHIGPGGSSYGQTGKDQSGKRDKEELADVEIVDWLRKAIGDPFLQNNGV